MTLGILPLTFHIKYLYGGLIILCFFEFSFLYPSLLTYCNFLYGAKLGPNVFALSLLGVAVTTITVSAMKSLLPLVGYGGVCYFIAGMMAITYSVIFKINQSSIIISKASLSKKLV